MPANAKDMPSYSNLQESIHEARPVEGREVYCSLYGWAMGHVLCRVRRRRSQIVGVVRKVITVLRPTGATVVSKGRRLFPKPL